MAEGGRDFWRDSSHRFSECYGVHVHICVGVRQCFLMYHVPHQQSGRSIGISLIFPSLRLAHVIRLSYLLESLRFSPGILGLTDLHLRSTGPCKAGPWLVLGASWSYGWTDLCEIFNKIWEESQILYMETNINFSSHLTHFFCEWEMLQTKVV